jgi:cytochrome c-type biogenesis protein CcmH/NrfG
MSSRQILVILLTAILAVLLYFAPKKGSVKNPETEGDTDFTTRFEEARKKLSPEQAKIFDKLEANLRKAQTENNEEAWMGSSNEFLKAARYFQDNNKALLYKEAISGFEKVLEINPKNLPAKTALGSAIVEGSGLLGTQPMKGITLLREVIAQDSANIEANLQLGLFSVTSRQFDKAIERFQRILRIDSTHIEMYVYMGDTYLTMGEKQKAIDSYENYKIRVKDTLITKDIDEYIKKLKTN